MRLRGHDTTALCLLGESLSRQEQHAEAERVFKAAAIPGGPVRALVGLAKSQSGQGALLSLLPWSFLLRRVKYIESQTGCMVCLSQTAHTCMLPWRLLAQY